MTNDPRRLVLVASNRGPVSFGFAENGSLTARRGGGGMVSGLTSGLAAAAADGGVLWLCAAITDADREAARRGERADGGPGEAPVRMIDIPEDMFDAAYNKVFADALADEYATGTRVLIQDYHLALAPRLLRDRHPGARIAHFEHTPWAPPDYYRLLPDDVAAAILDGMLGADHAGFLAQRWAEAFLDCCEAVLGAEVSRRGGGAGQVSHRGRVTNVAVHPLGVDGEALRERAREADVRAAVDVITGMAAGRQLIVRVDRTELSKNVIRGLDAYREFLIARPEWHGRVVHLAFAYPSRSGLAEYRDYTYRVHELADEINAEFRRPEWEPLILEVKDDYPRSLAACELADVLLVNPIRDGMNLVAEEGPILSERGCVLVLSREAGSAALIGGEALLVNPYDVSATAEALHTALCMPPGERRRRAAAMASAASARAPRYWLAEQLDALR